MENGAHKEEKTVKDEELKPRLQMAQGHLPVRQRRSVPAWHAQPSPVWIGPFPWRRRPLQVTLYEESDFRIALCAIRAAWRAILEPCIPPDATKTPDLLPQEARSSSHSSSNLQRAADLRRVWEETIPLWRWLTQLGHGCLHVVRWKTR